MRLVHCASWLSEKSSLSWSISCIIIMLLLNFHDYLQKNAGCREMSVNVSFHPQGRSVIFESRSESRDFIQLPLRSYGHIIMLPTCL